MEQYLIDTNIVSDYLSASIPVYGMNLMDKAIDAIPNISILTQIEQLCWNTDEATTESVKSFIADSVVQDISLDVIAHCVSLRKGKKKKRPLMPSLQPLLWLMATPLSLPTKKTSLISMD